MTKLFQFVMKNLGRNKLRTSLTGMAVVVLVAIHALVTSVTSAIKNKVNAQGAATRLLVSERWVAPSLIPVKYVPEIAANPEVTDWTVWHFYTGFLDADLRGDRLAAGIATRIDNLKRMHDGLEELDPKLVEKMARQKNGALVGTRLMQNMNWRVGQRFTLLSNSHPNKNLQFQIIGELPAGLWSANFFFREDYYQEGTGDKETVNLMFLRVADEAQGRKVMTRIQEVFESRPSPLKVETESASVARFAQRGQSILTIIDFVVAILLIDMVIILSNSISISVRERRVEMAVLKVLGFQPLQIMGMVIGEAMLVGGLAGAVGIGLVYLTSVLALNQMLPWPGVTGFFLSFPVHPFAMFWGLLLGAFIGLTGSAIPAWNARKVKVSDVFARIA